MGRFRTAADRIITEKRDVDDPMMTDAELIYRRRQAADRRSDSKRVGRVEITGNAMSRIGALCFIKDRLDYHERAAQWIKAAYESLYGSGMPAVDAGRIQVDTSVIASDAGIAERLDRGQVLYDLFKTLGKESTDRVVAVIVLGIAAGSDVDRLPSGKPNRRQQKRAVADVLEDLDRSAIILGFKSRMAA